MGVVRNGSFLSVRMPLPDRLCPSGVALNGGLIGSLGLMRGRGRSSSLRTFIGGFVGDIGPATMARGAGALGCSLATGGGAGTGLGCGLATGGGGVGMGLGCGLATGGGVVGTGLGCGLATGGGGGVGRGCGLATGGGDGAGLDGGLTLGDGAGRDGLDGSLRGRSVRSGRDGLSGFSRAAEGRSDRLDCAFRSHVRDDETTITAASATFDVVCICETPLWKWPACTTKTKLHQ